MDLSLEERRVSIKVTLLGAKHLHTHKGDKKDLHSFVKWSGLPKDTTVFTSPILRNSRNPEYEWISTGECTIDEDSIHGLFRSCLHVSIMEVHGQKDKHKDEIGHADIDWSVFLEPDAPLEWEKWVPLEGVPISRNKGAEDEVGEASCIGIHIVLERPLLTPAEASATSIVDVHLHGLFHPPLAWLGKAEDPKEDPDAPWKCIGAHAEFPSICFVKMEGGNAQGDTSRPSTAGSEALSEHGRLRSLTSTFAPLVWEEDQDSPAALWKKTVRALITPQMHAQLVEDGGKTPWRVEIWRSFHGAASDVADINANLYRGFVEVDISPLLIPGELALEGPYSVHTHPVPSVNTPIDDSEAPSTHRGSSREGKRNTPRSERSETGRNSRSSKRKEEKKKKKSVKPLKRGKEKVSKKSSQKLSKVVELLMVADEAVEGAFESAVSFVQVSIRTDRAWIVRIPTPRVVLAPTDLIPPKPQKPPIVTTADDALEAEVRRSVIKMAQEYVHVLCPDEQALWSIREGQGDEALRIQRFLGELERNGTLFELKERLKAPIVRVVRENYGKRKCLTAEELHEFVSQFYTDVLDKMTSMMLTMCSPHDVIPIPVTSKLGTQQRLSMLLREALEMELLGNGTQAEQIHKKRTMQRSHHPRVWLDGAECAMRRGDRREAERCLREILAADTTNKECLLMMGALMMESERWEDAEVFVTAVAKEVSIESKEDAKNALLGWKMMVDILSALDVREELESAKAQMEIAKSHVDSPELVMARWMVGRRFVVLGEQVMDSMPVSEEKNVLMARCLFAREQWEDATRLLVEVVDSNPACSSAWIVLGHLYWEQDESEKAIEAFTHALSGEMQRLDDPAEEFDWSPHSIRVRLGTLYAEQHMDLESKVCMLEVCRESPTAKSWLSVGKSCIQLKQLEQAEDALGEANFLDTSDGEIWAWLCLLSLHTKRPVVADQCLRTALRFGVGDAALLRAIAEEYEHDSPETAAQCRAHANEITE